MRDYDQQIAKGIAEPSFDARRFADMNIDLDAWVLEPQDNVRAGKTAVQTA
jgi:AGCS family alanine or glycine:cation symporter